LTGGLNVNGDIVASGDVTGFSDIRMKKDLEIIERPIEKVKQLNGYTYAWKDKDNERHVGVVAQEVKKILPEAVKKNEDGYYSVAYGNMVALLIEAIKEQQKQIDDLKEKVGEA
jgi:hypothetical protein